MNDLNRLMAAGLPWPAAKEFVETMSIAGGNSATEPLRYFPYPLAVEISRQVDYGDDRNRLVRLGCPVTLANEMARQIRDSGRDTAPPEVTVEAIIFGDDSPNGVLTLSVGSATGHPRPSRTISWLHNGTYISGETRTFLEKSGRIGSFSARVTWVNSSGSDFSDSNEIVTSLPNTDVAPQLAGGSLSMNGNDLVITPPTITAGSPDPTLTLVSLTRDGADVLAEISDWRIADATPGAYAARFVASNGVDPDAPVNLTFTVPLRTMTATRSHAQPEVGQTITWTFSAAPDGVTATLGGSAITVTGSGTEYSVTPATVGELIVTATKAGFVDYSDTVTVAEAGTAPDFSIDMTNGQTEVNGDGDIVLTWVEPVEYAGTHSQDRSVEYGGPLNPEYASAVAPQCVVAPRIERVSGFDGIVGGTYRVIVGLWMDDSASTLTQAGEWYLNGVATGVTDDHYNSADPGDLTYRESVVSGTLATRTAVSNTVTLATATETRTLFIAPDGTNLIGWADPTGRVWNADTRGAGDQPGFAKIYTNAIRNTPTQTSRMITFAPHNQMTGANHVTVMELDYPTDGGGVGRYGIGPAVNVSAKDKGLTGTDLHGRKGYYMDWTASTFRLWKNTEATPSANTSGAILTTAASYPITSGQRVRVALAREGNDVAGYLSRYDFATETYGPWAQVLRRTDTDIMTGGCGFGMINTLETANYTRNYGYRSYDEFTTIEEAS